MSRRLLHGLGGVVDPERLETKPVIEDLRDIVGGLLEQPEEVLAQRDQHPEVGRVVAEWRLPVLMRGVEVLRANPADQITERSQEPSASLLILKREHLLELVEDQYRRQEQIAAPEFSRLEVMPQRRGVPRMVFDLLPCRLAVDILDQADERQPADVVEPYQQRKMVLIAEPRG